MKLSELVKCAAFAAATAFAMPSLAAAEWKPAGPITLQIGFGAGGSTDTLGRAIATAMEANTGWDVIAENKPGGGGVAMLSSVVNRKPDGRTLAMGVTTPTLMNLATRSNSLPFKVDSFDYLATVVLAPLAIVAKADAPYDTFDELVAYSKANGGALIGFDGGPQKLIVLAVNNMAGAGFEAVSHKSGAEIIQGLLGGQLDAGYGAGAHIQYLESGDLKMLASAIKGRQEYAPDATTLVEQGYPYSIEGYFYIAAPKGLDPEAKTALAAALDEAIKSEEVGDVIGKVFLTVPNNLGPEGTEKELADGLAAIEELIRASN